MVLNCKQCSGKTLAGKRCQNRVSCEKGCAVYCHLHSKTYPKRNVVCTKPARRRAPKKTMAERGRLKQSRKRS